MSEALKQEILQLKKEKNAVLLCHIYQIPEVQDLADYVGDSLGLSQEAAKADCDIIVFCGVRFMAETAAMINPGKKVLIPDETAGCPMADMINPEQLKALKEKHPRAPVVCYVNSTAETKALSDICITSANALSIVKQLPEEKILFIPDKYLGMYIQSSVDKEIVLWPGYCPTHVKIIPPQIEEAKKKHPDAIVMVHPECTPQVQKLADHILSTGQMCKKAEELPDKEFIIGTEQGITYTLKVRNPDKEFFSVQPEPVCPNMKKITLEKVLWSLRDEKYEVTVEPETAEKAKKAIIRMLAMS